MSGWESSGKGPVVPQQLPSFGFLPTISTALALLELHGRCSTHGIHLLVCALQASNRCDLAGTGCRRTPLFGNQAGTLNIMGHRQGRRRAPS